MATFNVFIDTSIFIKNKFTFHAGPLDSLEKYCQKGYCTLFTNNIILREVEKHIKTDVGELAAQAKNAMKKTELVNAISKQEYSIIAEKILSAPDLLLAQFRTFTANAICLPIDTLSLASVFDDYFNTVPPFENKKDKKAEFPDAVAIMSIKHFLQETDGASMCVVSDDDGWAKAFDGAENVAIYRDIRSLLTDISKKEEVLYEQIALFMGNHVVELASAVESWLYEQDCSSIIEDIGPCIECDELEDLLIGEIIITPHSVDFIDTENKYAIVGFSGTAKATIDFSYLDHTEEVYDREDRIWLNTIYGNGSIEIKVPFTGSVTVLFSDEGDEMNLEDPNLEGIGWDDVEVTVLKMKAHRQNDDPFYCTCPDCGRPIGIHNDGGNGFCVECAYRH